MDQSAKQGNVCAQYNLADIYNLGSQDGPPMTIPVDPQLSFKWNLAAAEQELLATFEGSKIGRNDYDIVCWTAAMFNVGLAYSEGRGVEQNDETAFEWCMKAAIQGQQGQVYHPLTYRHIVINNGQGYAEVFQSVGYFYENGKGVDVDLVQAMHWYQKSAAQGFQYSIEAVETLVETFKNKQKYF